MSRVVTITMEQEKAINEHLKGMGVDGIINHILELKLKLYDEHSVTTPSLSLLSQMKLTDLIYALHGDYEIEKPKVKVGEWATNTGCNHTFKVYAVTDRQVVRKEDAEFWDIASMTSIRWYPIENTIPATKEEVFWAEMGREVGEFKEGDVRLINDYSSVYTTATVVAKNEYDNGELTGFYPVESFKRFPQ
jgi:hypothetical protein